MSEPTTPSGRSGPTRLPAHPLKSHSTWEIVTDAIGRHWAETTRNQGPHKLGHDPLWVKKSDVDAALTAADTARQALELQLSTEKESCHDATQLYVITKKACDEWREKADAAEVARAQLAQERDMWMRSSERLEEFYDAVQETHSHCARKIREAEASRDALIQQLAALASVKDRLLKIHRHMGNVRSLLDRIKVTRTKDHDDQDRTLGDWQEQLFLAFGELTELAAARAVVPADQEK